MPKINQLAPTSQLSNTDLLAIETPSGTSTRKVAYSSLRQQIQNESKSVFALHGEIVSDDQIVTAVDNWLSSHMSIVTDTVIDPTLSIHDAAADAESAGKLIVINDTPGTYTKVSITTTDDDVELAEAEDVRNLALYNAENFIPHTIDAEWVQNGITWMDRGNSIIAYSGTMTNPSEGSQSRYYLDKAQLPDWAERGKTYYAKVESSNPKMFLSIIYYDSDEQLMADKTIYLHSDSTFTIPDDAYGAMIRAYLGTNAVVSGTEEAKIAILSAESNASLTAKVEALLDKVPHLYDYNAFNYIGDALVKTASNLAGTFTWTDLGNGTVSFIGEVSDATQFLYYRDYTHLPDWAEIGKTYYVKVKTDSQRIRLNILCYDSNGQILANSSVYYYEDGTYTIPEGAVGMMVRLYCDASTTISELSYISSAILNADSNAGLTDKLSIMAGQISSLSEEISSAESDVTAVQDSISNLDASLRLDENLINAGIYSISASELVSGSWWNGSPHTDSTRARFPFLIPVHVGMTFEYTVTDYDVFFGVLATPESQSYVQGGVWCTTSGNVTINRDGFMTFVVRYHADGTVAITPSNWDGSAVIRIAGCGRKTIPSGTDFDTYTSLGSYFISQTYTDYVNSPLPVGAYGTLEVFTGSHVLAPYQTIVQRVTNGIDGNVYVRTSVNNSFANRAWYCIGSSDKGAIPNGTDFNNIVVEGAYFLSPDYQYSNNPLSDYRAGILEVIASDGKLMQRVTDRSNGNVYIRATQWDSSLSGVSWKRVGGTEVKGTVPIGTDFDSIKEIGIYSLGGADFHYTNSPLADDDTGVLEVMFAANHTLMQRVTALHSGNTYIRISNPAERFDTPWQSVGSFNNGIIPNGTNFNNIVAEGSYFINSQAGYSNNPLDTYSEGILDVTVADGVIRQRVSDLYGGPTYIRTTDTTFSGSYWNMDGKPDLGHIPDGTDFNNIRAWGWYYISWSDSYTNNPLSSGYDGCLEVISAGTHLVQRVLGRNDSAKGIFVRMSRTVGTVQTFANVEWSYIPTDSEVSGYIQDAASDLEDEMTASSRYLSRWIEQVQDAQDDKASAITEVVSGPVASCPDAAEVLVKSMNVHIEPVQDLHGYDNPWPAGGGKNLIDYLSCIGVGARNGTDSIYSSNTSISGNNLTITQTWAQNGGILKGIKTFSLNQDSSVTISGNITLSGTTKIVVGIGNYEGGGTSVIDQNVTPSNGRFTITLTAASNYTKTCIYLQPATAGSSITVSNMQVEYGSTATSYAPYSNVCPITGFTAARVMMCGKNLGFISADNMTNSQTSTQTYENNGVTVSATGQYARAMYRFAVKKGETYTVSFRGYKGEGYGFVYVMNSESWDVNAGSPYVYMAFGVTTTEAVYSKTFTAVMDELYIGFYVSTNDTTGSIVIKDFQLELGSTATSYAPYSGNNYDIDWQTEAGTVYGGTLNVTTGVLTVDRAMWTKNTSTMDNAEEYPGWLNSGLRQYVGGGLNNVITGVIGNIGNRLAINSNSTNDTALLLKTHYNKTQTEWVALAQDVQFVVPLTEPIEYQLDPVTLSMLLGTNNIWADTGDVIVTYRADTKMYINRKLAELAASLTEH